MPTKVLLTCLFLAAFLFFLGKAYEDVDRFIRLAAILYAFAGLAFLLCGPATIWLIWSL